MAKHAVPVTPGPHTRDGTPTSGSNPRTFIDKYGRWILGAIIVLIFFAMIKHWAQSGQGDETNPAKPTQTNTAQAQLPIVCPIMQIEELDSCQALYNAGAGNYIPVPGSLPAGYHRCFWHGSPSGGYSQSTAIYKYIGVKDLSGNEVPWHTGMEYVQGIHMVVYTRAMLTYALHQGACPANPEDILPKARIEPKVAQAEPVKVVEKTEEKVVEKTVEEKTVAAPASVVETPVVVTPPPVIVHEDGYGYGYYPVYTGWYRHRYVRSPFPIGTGWRHRSAHFTWGGRHR
jgi:hypothetical protein